MTELKSCPFCSGGTKDDHKPGLVASGGLWRVMCGYCDSSTGWRSSPEEAVKVWNNRFVCPGKNGKPVFVGDDVRLSCSDRSTLTRIGIATMPPCIKLDGVDVPVRLIKEDAKARGVSYKINLIEDAT